VTEGGYPAQLARTRRFTLGIPRGFSVAADGSRVAFLRSSAGDDPVTSLWVLDVARGEERLVADPRELQSGPADGAEFTDAERARRERARETAGGIVAYGGDRDLRAAAFSLNGRLFVADLLAGGARELQTPGRVDDPRLDPTGRRVAYVAQGALHVRDLGGGDRVLAREDDPEVSWGLPEYIAAEEMDRLRGFWWSPDGERLAAARVDDRPVPTWFVGDPAEPARAPRALRYPVAGGSNANVSLSVFDAQRDGARVDVAWDTERFPYLARVDWTEGSPLTLLLQSRDQRTASILEVDDASGLVAEVHRETDDAWVELVPGSPTRLDDGRLVLTADRDGARVLLVGDEVVTGRATNVRSVVPTGREVIVSASDTDDPTSVYLARVMPGGEPGARSLGAAAGVSSPAAGGDVVVVTSRSESAVHPAFSVLRSHGGREREIASIGHVAEEPLVDPRPTYLSAGERDLRCALLLPSGGELGGPLPVLLDPYGGPHHQRVVRHRGAYLTSQWFANQGFAVLVADGRGTPGRGPGWERAIRGDLALVLDDQVDALRAVAELHPGVLDRERVAIRGWSFGGYLAAMAVLRRPDVFGAAIAGAPVTDWSLYDTHYTERYLGLPQEQPDAYLRSSILRDASKLSRPLMLVHGIADDNVVVAHTLRLSAALFEAGRHHELVLLSNVTHMAGARFVEQNLLHLELDFLRRSLERG
jgi:dipeptidyl-peptidase-4